MSLPSSPEPERIPADEVEVVDGERGPRWVEIEGDSPELILVGTVTGGTPESRLRVASEAIAAAINEDMRVRREKAQQLAVRASIDRAAARVEALLEGRTLDP